MGYFANGTEGADYQETYCVKCAHDQNNDCPVWLMHLLWNYEQHKDDEIRASLDRLIPFKDGENQQCKMFIRWAW
jgi:hypothetical protein